MALVTKLYPRSSRAEIDLRAELQSFFHGSSLEIPKAQPFVFRRMNRDANGHLIQCECVDPITKEPDMDHICPYCLSESYYWTETVVEGRKVILTADATGFSIKNKYLEAGLLNTQSAVFYFEYELEPTFYDRVVEVNLNLDGTIETPVRRRKIYRPHTVYDYRSDNGRVEYWGIFCTEKDAIITQEEFNK